MAGPVPTIHVLLVHGSKDADARHKAGHDEVGGAVPQVDLLNAR
jgi:hypothetical protein